MRPVRGVTLRLRVAALSAALAMTTAWVLLTVDNVGVSQGVDTALRPLGLSLQNTAGGQPSRVSSPHGHPPAPGSSLLAAQHQIHQLLEQ